MTRHAADRAVRIELLRARAALERESLRRHAGQLGRSVSRAGNVLRPLTLFSGMARSGNAAQLVMRLAGLAGRYPVLTSTLSAWMMGRKRSRLLKLASAALVGWQVYRAWRERTPGPKSDQPAASRYG
jgi:hypothetical protein